MARLGQHKEQGQEDAGYQENRDSVLAAVEFVGHEQSADCGSDQAC